MASLTHLVLFKAALNISCYTRVKTFIAALENIDSIHIKNSCPRQRQPTHS